VNKTPKRDIVPVYEGPGNFYKSAGALNPDDIVIELDMVGHFILHSKGWSQYTLDAITERTQQSLILHQDINESDNNNKDHYPVINPPRKWKVAHATDQKLKLECPVYERPLSTSKQLGKLTPGDHVIETGSVGPFLRHAKGWSPYLNDSGVDLLTLSRGRIWEITAKSLPVYAGPNQAKKVGEINQGQVIEEIDFLNEWIKHSAGWSRFRSAENDSTKYMEIESESKNETGVGRRWKIVYNGGLNIRTGPSLEYPSVGVVKFNEVVTQVEHCAEWIKHDKGGWSAFTTIPPNKSEYMKLHNSGEPRQWHVFYSGVLNIRSGPGLHYDTLGQMKVGEIFTEIAHVGGWLQHDRGWTTYRPTMRHTHFMKLLS